MSVSVNEVNRRVNLLLAKQRAGKASASEQNELRHSMKLVGEVAERAFAVPAAQFTNADEWSRHFNGGDVSPIVIDDRHAPQTSEQSSGDELPPDEVAALEKLLRDAEGK